MAFELLQPRNGGYEEREGKLTTVAREKT